MYEVMDTLRPVDSYVAELITALRKAFEVAQTEALRQKRRYDQKALTVTLNKGDVVLMRNDQFVGKRKLKDCWGDEVYTMCNQVVVDVLVCHQKSVRSKANPSLFLIEKADPEVDPQVAARLFNVPSTEIGSKVQHREMSKASTPLIEIQACAACPLSIDAQNTQELTLLELIIHACKAL